VLVQHSHGVVLTHLEFVADHRKLLVEVFFLDEGIHHAVRFQVERPLQVLVGGFKCFEVIGAIEAGGAVPLAAVLGNLLHDIGVFRAALKQHVLQQVRHAAFAVAFVILVADDEVLIRNLVTLLLQHEEYFVLSAADGHEGLELSRKYPGPIDLVITSPKWLATAGAAEDQRRKE
jgi:PleD family two-component response regulator